jgi:hypothetical protein
MIDRNPNWEDENAAADDEIILYTQTYKLAK